MDIAQAATGKTTGRFSLEEPGSKRTIRSTSIGELQTTGGWASFTGLAAVDSGREQALVVIVDRADPRTTNVASVVVYLDGSVAWSGTHPPSAVTITP